MISFDGKPLPFSGVDPYHLQLFATKELDKVHRVNNFGIYHTSFFCIFQRMTSWWFQPIWKKKGRPIGLFLQVAVKLQHLFSNSHLNDDLFDFEASIPLCTLGIRDLP